MRCGSQIASVVNYLFAAINCFRGSVGDPHLQFNGGGKADFRGSHRAYYAFVNKQKPVFEGN